MGRREVPLDDVTKLKLEALKAAKLPDDEELSKEDAERLNAECRKRRLPEL